MSTSPSPAATPAAAAAKERTSPFRYGVGMFGTSIPINLIKGSMLYVYVDLLGMNAGVYAAVYAVYSVIDAIDNPLFGYWSDRTRSRWGRRKPFLIAGSLALLVGTIALFWVPDAVSSQTAGLVLWFAVFAIMSEAADSMINANYGALLPELFPAEKRRAVANSMRQGFQLLALIVSMGLTPMLARSILGCERTKEMCDGDTVNCAASIAKCPDPTAGYQKLAIIYAILATIIIIYMALGVKENREVEAEQRPKFLASIGQILTNRYFWTIGIVGACYGGAMALVLSMNQSYAKYTLGLDGTQTTIMLGVVILCSVGFLNLWTAIVRRRGATWTWRVAFIVGTLGFLPMIFAFNLVTGLIAGIFLGLGWAGMLATNDLITARVLDADAAEHGIHREGIFLSAFGVLGRLSGVLLSVAIWSATLFFGYESGDDPGSNPGLAFRFLMGVYPCVLFAIGAVVSRLIKVPGDDAKPETVAAVRDEMSD